MNDELWDEETGCRLYEGDLEAVRHVPYPWREHPSNPTWTPAVCHIEISSERRAELAGLLEEFDRSHG